MKRHVAMNAMNFLRRSDLKGSEVPAFIDVMESLQQVLDEPDSVDEAVNGAAPAKADEKNEGLNESSSDHADNHDLADKGQQVGEGEAVSGAK